MGINLPRKLLHLFFSLFLYFLYLKLSLNTFQILLGFFLLLLSLWELIRLKKPHLLPLKRLWESLLKKREKHSPTDALFFLLGIFSSTFIAPYEFIGVIILILGLADPLAEFSGRLLKGKKTLSGERPLRDPQGFSFLP